MSENKLLYCWDLFIVKHILTWASKVWYSNRKWWYAIGEKSSSQKKNPRWLPHCDIITCKWGVFLFFNKEHWVFVNVFLIDSEPISLTISLALNKKCPIKKRRSWAGSSRISIIWSRRNNFCFMSHAEKINSSRDIALFESSIWLWEEALDSSSLRVNVN